MNDTKTPSEQLKRFENEVAAGVRDARSLVAIPADMAQRATLTFPKDAFGEPQAWDAELALDADFVAAHNETVEAEGLPLDAWRAF